MSFFVHEKKIKKLFKCQCFAECNPRVKFHRIFSVLSQLTKMVASAADTLRSGA